MVLVYIVVGEEWYGNPDDIAIFLTKDEAISYQKQCEEEKQSKIDYIILEKYLYI